MNTVNLFWIGFLLAIDPTLTPPGTAELISAAVQNRDAITRGDLEFDLRFGSIDQESQAISWNPPVIKDRMVFDRREGFYAFVERWTPGAANYGHNSMTTVQSDGVGGNITRIVVRPDFVYEYLPLPLSNGQHLAISEFLASAERERNPRERVLRPWNFNLIPELIIDDTFPSYESVIKTSPDYRPAAVEADFIDGEDCWKVQFVTYDHRTVTVWHSIAKGMTICRIVMEGTNQNGSWKNTLNSKLQSYDEGKIWFPAEVVLRSEMIGGKPDDGVLLLHRIHVSSARINTEVDPEQFTIKALKSISHTTINRQYESEQPTEEWDGERVALVSRPLATIDSTDLRQQLGVNSAKPLLLLLGNVLLLSAVIFVCTRRWRSKM